MVLRKTMENLRKNRDSKLVATNKRRGQLVSKSNYLNYLTTNWFSKTWLAIKTKKTKVKKNKRVYLGISMLDISNTRCMNFGIIILNWNIKTKQNYATWILIVLLFILKLKIFMKVIANDVEKWFDTSNYDEDDKNITCNRYEQESNWCF